MQVEMQNRLPITWSDKAAKIATITPWTASADYPHGQERAAEAILDFWTSDWIALADQLRRGEAGLRPRLHERPMLKMGRHLFQLPWMMAVQNNATAAVNNLRRLGARRGDARDETRRIEQRLAALFAQRGFQVLVSHELPSLSADAPNGEEIDLLCARDGQVLVLETEIHLSAQICEGGMDAPPRDAAQGWTAVAQEGDSGSSRTRTRRIAAAGAGLGGGLHAGDHCLDRRHVHRMRPPAFPRFSEGVAGRSSDCVA
jgi:hypothetical protein